MGNKLGRRRQVVDEKFTRPQGLYVHKDVDVKKLRKLILELKLAPCYPGDEECCFDLEECPICFLCYPSLNRSRCCMKGICTECFLQMKNPNSARPTQCPFCKTANYAVEYRGVRTKEEKGMEQIEEQRVIEAKIRMRQQELLDEEERMQKRQDSSSSSTSVAPGEVEFDSEVPSRSSEGEGNVPFQDLCATPMIRQPSHHRANGDDEFDLDLEDIMVTEAIWLSIQENGRQRSPIYDAALEQYVTEDRYVSSSMAPMAGSSSSPSGGLASAVAALAERQQMSVESLINHSGNLSSFNMLPGSSRLYNQANQNVENYASAESSVNASPDGRMTVSGDGEWGVDRGSEVAEAGTSYASSEATEDGGGISSLPPSEEIGGNFQNVPGPIVPVSFEEQMMLAVAVSLADARSTSNGPEVSWQ